MNEPQRFQSAFVTGATGLLGNNLVRALIARGISVRALARSPEKAQRQFGSLPIEFVYGDMTDVDAFADKLRGVDVVFHTAAFFRDTYKGGKHWSTLFATNVNATSTLLKASYASGVRRFVHTSSVAVLQSPSDRLADETLLRDPADADDYYRSKIYADREVLHFLEAHPDLWAAFVLPGWIHGPGDLGPTSVGESLRNYLRQKLPGAPPARFSVVDARDVAEIMIRIAEQGRRGERYLAAGPSISMRELFTSLERLTGIPSPRRDIPLAPLYVIGAANELVSRLTGRPVLLGWSAVRLMAMEGKRAGYDYRKTRAHLGVALRPLEETLRDEIAWLIQHDASIASLLGRKGSLLAGDSRWKETVESSEK